MSNTVIKEELVNNSNQPQNGNKVLKGLNLIPFNKISRNPKKDPKHLYRIDMYPNSNMVYRIWEFDEDKDKMVEFCDCNSPYDGVSTNFFFNTLRSKMGHRRWFIQPIELETIKN